MTTQASPIIPLETKPAATELDKVLSRAITSTSAAITPIRLMILGPPGVGKTFSALTFPNPIYGDLDNKLKGYRVWRPDHAFPVFPFWSRDFVEGVMKVGNVNGRIDPKYGPNVRDAFKKWLTEDGPKLAQDSTFVLDSWTSLQNFFDIQSQLPHEQVISPKTGKPDGFAFWGDKLKYCVEILKLLTNLKCNVVIICHEMPERDEDNRIIGIKPLMQGSGKDQMGKDATDVFRQRVLTKDTKGIPGYENKGESGNFVPPEGCSFNERGEAYVWQTCKDQHFQIACKSNPFFPNYVPATYESFGKEWKK